MKKDGGWTNGRIGYGRTDKQNIPCILDDIVPRGPLPKERVMEVDDPLPFFFPGPSPNVIPSYFANLHDRNRQQQQLKLRISPTLTLRHVS